MSHRNAEAAKGDAGGTADTHVREAVRQSAVKEVSSGDTEQRATSLRSLESWGPDDGLESQPPVNKGELVGGKYLVDAVFAEGGMGIVCFGRHVQLDQPVAIKFLRRALSGRDSIVQRFLNEARALAALRSEHVVRVMDVGQLESGRPYLVMEHLDGIDLGALVERDGPLDVDTAVRYVIQICEPLAEAHELGIVHRDIKLENLFLWSGGPGRDVVKVLDFGLAKRLGSTSGVVATGPQDSMGSPCYMSPEQIVTPQLVDARTDIWSLGVVLHQLLTDTVPFDGTDVTAVFAHVLNAAPTQLVDLLPAAGAELNAIVLKCLEKSPENRYATMADLATALRSYLTHRQAGPPQDTVTEVPEVSRARVSASRDDDGKKIRIPGVHARWPGVLAVMLALASAAIYQADRTGRIRLRDLTDGWLTPAQMRLEAGPEPAMQRKMYEPLLVVARGVFAVEPVPDGSLAETIRAEPEPEIEPTGPQAPETAAPAPMTDAERARRRAAYRDYLTDHGLSLLHDSPPQTSGASDLVE